MGLLAALVFGGGLLLLTIGLATRMAPPPSEEEAGMAPAGTSLERLIDQLTAPLGAAGRASITAEALLRADINLKPQEWYAFRVLLPVLAAAWLFLLNGVLPMALVVGLIVYMVPGLLLRSRRHARRAALVRQLPEALQVMASSLESGSTVIQAVQVVAETMAPPISDEFTRVVREVSLGVAVDEALGRVAERFESRDFAILVSAVQLNRQMGGSLAEVLTTITGTMRERVRLIDRVRVLTSQARASAYIVTLLPFAIALLLSILAPGYMSPLYTNPLGLLAILVALILFAIAWVVMGRITQVEV